MSFQPRAGRSAGAISYTFEGLPITRESGERRGFGVATIAFDGAGGYWPTSIALESSTFGVAPKILSDGSPLWREVTRRLEQYHSDAIAERINTALDAHGLHMALFGEHLPPATVRRSAPPYVSPAARRATVMLDRAAVCVDYATLAFAGALVLFCALQAEARHEGGAPASATAASLVAENGR